MPATAEEHPLIRIEGFRSAEELVVYLMHRFAYEDIARRLGRVSAVLDLGCNIGYGLPILRGAADEVVGADVSPTAVAAATRLVAGSGIAVHPIDENRPLPFADGRFDAVVSCQVIEHVADVDGYLREIRRVLKPDGRAFLTTPNRLIRLDPGMTPWNPHHLREYAPEGLAAAIAAVFPVVELLGLCARPEVDAIERSRVAAARERARDPVGLRGRIRAILPGRLRGVLKAVLAPSPSDPGPAADLPAFGTADFEYRAGDATEALDLLAVARLSPAR